MDPTLSGFALGLLLGVAKLGIIGTVGFGIAWWRSRTRLRRLEAALPDPARLEERLANLESQTDYMAGQLDRLVEAQGTGATLPPSGLEPRAEGLRSRL